MSGKHAGALRVQQASLLQLVVDAVVTATVALANRVRKRCQDSIAGIESWHLRFPANALPLISVPESNRTGKLVAFIAVPG